MVDIKLITLSSLLAGQDSSLKDEVYDFLAKLDPEKRINFVDSPKAFPLFVIASGGSEAKFKAVYKRYPGPYFICPLGNRNSFAASLEIQSFLASKGLKSVFMNGDDKDAMEYLLSCGRAYSLLKKVKGKRLGLIGGPSDWLIASQCDPRLVKKKLGIDIVRIPTSELEKEINNQNLGDEKTFFKLRKKTERLETLRGSLYIHSALLAIKKKYFIDGFTLRCFDLLDKYQNTSCLAFALLNDAGFTAACEGDVPSLLTMYLIQALTDKPSFMANPERMDVTHKEAVYAHCTCPFSMGNTYSLMTHFESGMGFGIRLKLAKQEVTMVKIAPELDRVVLKKGKILNNLEEDDICRTQIRVKFEDDISDCLEHPAGNHMVFTYDNVASTLSALMDIVNS